MNFRLVQPEQLNIRESRGLVKDIHDPVISVREPLSDYQTMLQLIHSDPTLSRAFDIIVEFSTYRGFDFIGADKAKRDKLRILFDSLNYRQVLPNIMYSLCYYGDSFMELRKNDSSKPNELWPLETTEMRIDYDVNGKVAGYIQRPFNITGMKNEEIKEKERTIVPKSDGGDGVRTYGVFWEPEEVIHTRMKWIGSQVYSYNPNEAIATLGSAKLYSDNYLMNIFMNMPPRYVAHLSGISQKDYQTAKREFQSTKTNYKKVIAFSRSSDPQSKLELKKIDPPYDKELIDVKRWLNNEVLKITGVPRSWIEESASENRGVTEAEQRPFDVRIQYIHRNVLEPMENGKLLPALGFFKKPSGTEKRVRLRHNEISRKGEKEILENVKVLKEMGLKPEAVVTYLDERGILGLDPDDFRTAEDMAMLAGKMMPGIPGGKDKDDFPSRKPMNKGMEDMTQNRNEAGVSDAGGKKIEART